MAVEVISKGPVFTRATTCRTCCYRLSYTGEDVLAEPDPHNPDNPDMTDHFIKCAHCGHDVFVPRWIPH